MKGQVIYVTLMLWLHSLAYAQPGKSESIKIPKRRPEVITVDHDREYSSAELDVLFESHARDTTRTTSSSEASSSTTDVPRGHNTLESNLLSGKPIYMHQRASVEYQSACPSVGADNINFIVDVTFNGKKVLYKNRLNLEKFGDTTVGGGLGEPITSTAEFRHSVCRAYRWTKTFALMCKYEYYGTLTTEVTVLGDRPGIKVDAYKPDHEPVGYAPTVYESCKRIYPNMGARCSISLGDPCPIQDIHTSPMNYH